MLLEVGKIKLLRHRCDTSQKKPRYSLKRKKYISRKRWAWRWNSSGKSREAPETEHGLRDKGSSKHWDEARSELQEGRGVMLGLEHRQEQRSGCPEQPLQNVKVMLTVLSKRKWDIEDGHLKRLTVAQHVVGEHHCKHCIRFTHEVLISGEATDLL